MYRVFLWEVRNLLSVLLYCGWKDKPSLILTQSKNSGYQQRARGLCHPRLIENMSGELPFECAEYLKAQMT